MITFENKEIESLREGDKKMTYADLSMVSLNSPVQQGMSVKEIGQRIKLIDEFKALEAGKTLELTKESYELLSTCVEGMKWAIVHQGIVEFSEYVTSIKSSDNPELPASKEA